MFLFSRFVFGTFLFLRLTTGGLLATPPSPCYNADDDTVFATAEPIAFGDPMNTRIPQFSASEGKPAVLEWVPVPPGTEVQNEKVGSFRGRDIYRVIYRGHDPLSARVEPSILCIWFGYQVAQERGGGLCPFFVRTQDIRWFDSYFASEKKQPFGLEISITRDGNGVYTTWYSFAFTPEIAHIVTRLETGRHVPVKTYDYGISGKVIATRISKGE